MESHVTYAIALLFDKVSVKSHAVVLSPRKQNTRVLDASLEALFLPDWRKMAQPTRLTGCTGVRSHPAPTWRAGAAARRPAIAGSPPERPQCTFTVVGVDHCV